MKKSTINQAQVELGFLRSKKITVKAKIKLKIKINVIASENRVDNPMYLTPPRDKLLKHTFNIAHY